VYYTFKLIELLSADRKSPIFKSLLVRESLDMIKEMCYFVKVMMMMMMMMMDDDDDDADADDDDAGIFKLIF